MHRFSAFWHMRLPHQLQGQKVKSQSHVAGAYCGGHLAAQLVMSCQNVYIDDVGSLCALDRGCHIILYADDVLLIAPTVSKMENLLHICERELYWLDMSIIFLNKKPS